MMELEPAHPGLAGEEPTVAENDRARREGRNGRRIFAAALVPLTIYAIHILRLPLDALLGVVPDDAFYYLSIARHLAASGFSSLDGINPTNGYHPAWMLLTTLCAGIIDDREMLLRGVLLLGMLLHVGTGLLLARIVRRLFGELWGWTGGALWLVNPFPLLLDLQGVETPFYFLALALVIDRLVSLILRHPDEDVPIPPSTGWLATLGAFLGLAFLGRSEAIVMATGSLLLLAWMLRRGGIVAILRSLSIVSLTFLLVVSPWLLYSWRLLGMAAQDSA